MTSHATPQEQHARSDWWGTWAPTYRDVLIADADGELAGIYNLTDNSLSDDGNYDALKQMLIDAAQGQ